MPNRKLGSIPSILKRLYAVKEVSQIEVIVYKVVAAQVDRIAEMECSAAPFSDC